MQNVGCRCDRIAAIESVSYTHLRAHETVLDLVCRLLLEKKKKIHNNTLQTRDCHKKTNILDKYEY